MNGITHNININITKTHPYDQQLDNFIMILFIYEDVIYRLFYLEI